MPLQLMKKYTREIIQKNPEKLFVFGDNCARVGHGGQAGEARGEPNAVGICTKKTPSYLEADFFTDAEYLRNVGMIVEDLRRVGQHLANDGLVVWPADNIGTGLARLPEKAPQTMAFISETLGFLRRRYGVVGEL